MQSREEGSLKVLERPIEKKIYLIIKFTADITNIFCTKEKQKEKNSAELLIFEQLDN